MTKTGTKFIFISMRDVMLGEEAYNKACNGQTESVQFMI